FLCVPMRPALDPAHQAAGSGPALPDTFGSIRAAHANYRFAGPNGRSERCHVAASYCLAYHWADHLLHLRCETQQSPQWHEVTLGTRRRRRLACFAPLDAPTAFATAIQVKYSFR